MPSSSSSFAANNILSKKARCRNQLVHCLNAPVLIQTHHQGFDQRRTELSEVPTSATRSYAAPFALSQAIISCSYIRGRAPRCSRFQLGAGTAEEAVVAPCSGRALQRGSRSTLWDHCSSGVLKIEHQLLSEPRSWYPAPHLRPPISLMPRPDRFILLSVSDSERLPRISAVLSLITRVKKPKQIFFSITWHASCAYFRLWEAATKWIPQSDFPSAEDHSWCTNLTRNWHW